MTKTWRTALLTLLAGSVLACSGGGGGDDKPATYAISGRVTTSGGAGAARVTLGIAGGPSTVTDGSGGYSFGGLASGSYTITPALAGYEFAPASITVTVEGTDMTGRDFTMSSGRWGYLVWGQDKWK